MVETLGFMRNFSHESSVMISVGDCPTTTYIPESTYTTMYGAEEEGTEGFASTAATSSSIDDSEGYQGYESPGKVFPLLLFLGHFEIF